MEQLTDTGCITILTEEKRSREEANGIKTGRAWLEIKLDHLIHNAEALKALMPEKCALMAVVKANAYGHGACRVAECLNGIGVEAFAVATIDEGIALRKQGIHGEILILGYTDIARIHQLVHYDLMQTVVDYDYAEKLSGCKCRVSVHIKVDTGMHRLGLTAEEPDKIAKVFRLPYLRICGIFTHLCISDSLDPKAVTYTKGQINKFYAVLKNITDRGLTLPKLHIQSSYGLLNYPELHCDYARIGIALYGSLSAPGDRTRLCPELWPVLSLKARVALVREVKEGEGVGYGRDFTVEKNSRIAILPIGYADGLPRSLSYGKGSVLIGGRRAPIIGRICMDQLLVDVTGMPEIRQGDIATLIGKDGDEEITAASVAKGAGSIANELLSRLGTRLEKIYI